MRIPLLAVTQSELCLSSLGLQKVAASQPQAKSFDSCSTVLQTFQSFHLNCLSLELIFESVVFSLKPQSSLSAKSRCLKAFCSSSFISLQHSFFSLQDLVSVGKSVAVLPLAVLSQESWLEMEGEPERVEEGIEQVFDGDSLSLLPLRST